MAYHELPPEVLENATELTMWAQWAIQRAASAGKSVKQAKRGWGPGLNDEAAWVFHQTPNQSPS